MIKIFKQLGRHWAACIAVVALLFVQAYCDLSLPDYTSKIVDIGIQQGGIESPVPETVRDTTLQALELLMSEQDAALAEQWYSAPDADGVRTLSHDVTAAMSELENAFATPDIVLYMAAAKNAATAAGTADAVTPTAYDLDAVATQFAAMSQAPGAREMLQSQLAAAFASLDDSVTGSLSSQAMLLVALEYEAQGIAHDAQMGYLLRTGGRMLALTLLMVAVAIAVGFIASRVSAGIGRDLRRDVFRTVVGYSNAEIEKFSHCIAHHPHDQRHSAGAVRLRYPAAHGGLCADPRHRRHPACGRRQHGADMDHLCRGGGAAAAHRCADECRHAQVQADADPCGSAEPCQPRDSDRHYADPRLQPRGL